VANDPSAKCIIVDKSSRMGHICNITNKQLLFMCIRIFNSKSLMLTKEKIKLNTKKSNTEEGKEVLDED